MIDSKPEKDKKEPQDTETSTDFLSTIGLFVAMPLLFTGLFVQAYLSLTLNWQFQLLSLSSLFIGLAGLGLSFSELKKGIIYGSSLIFIAAILSVFFSVNTDVLNETQSTAMIIIGTIITTFFGIFNYIVYHWEPKSK